MIAEAAIRARICAGALPFAAPFRISSTLLNSKPEEP